MIRRHQLASLLIVTLGLLTGAGGGGGCTKCYLDPKPPDVHFTDLRGPRGVAIPVVINAEYQLNGKRMGGNSKELLKAAKKVLKQTGLFEPIDVKAGEAVSDAATITLVMNEIGSLGEAAGKGAVSGLTFGLAGQQMGETIDLSGTFQPVGTPSHAKHYQQLVYIVTGGHKTPEVPGPALGPFTVGDVVTEKLLLNFVKDLQDEGAL